MKRTLLVTAYLVSAILVLGPVCVVYALAHYIEAFASIIAILADGVGQSFDAFWRRYP